MTSYKNRRSKKKLFILHNNTRDLKETKQPYYTVSGLIYSETQCCRRGKGLNKKINEDTNTANGNNVIVLNLKKFTLAESQEEEGEEEIVKKPSIQLKTLQG